MTPKLTAHAAPWQLAMQWIHCLVLGLLLLPCGCARSYVMTMNNGSRITTASKPKLNEGVYVFKDAQGRESSVPAGRVREIQPASMVTDDKARFNPSGK